MPLFFIVPGKQKGDLISLSEKESHHLRNVQRVKARDLLKLTDGEGSYFEGEVISVSSKVVSLKILKKETPEEPKTKLHIGQSLLKKDKMEWVVEKCVELGVYEIHPFTSSRTIAQFKGENKKDRLEKIVDAATKQCERTTRMKIHPHKNFEELFSKNADLKIIFWEKATLSLRQFFQGKSQPSSVVALIGPEGGFSDEEIDLACQHGYETVSLGQRILRAETAAIVATTVIQYELGNLSK